MASTKTVSSMVPVPKRRLPLKCTVQLPSDALKKPADPIFGNSGMQSNGGSPSKQTLRQQLTVARGTSVRTAIRLINSTPIEMVIRGKFLNPGSLVYRRSVWTYKTGIANRDGATPEAQLRPGPTSIA